MRTKTFKLQTTNQRRNIKPHNDPYYTTLYKGLSLGYRKAPGTKVETWTARARSGKEYAYKALGAVTVEHDFKWASNAAKDWETKESTARPGAKTGGKPRALTVKQLIEEYIKKHAPKRSKEWKYTTERFAKAYIYNQSIATLWPFELTVEDFEDLQDELLAKPLTGETVNRVTVPLRAALNWELKRGHLSEAPWKNCPACDEAGAREKKRSKHYFPKDERVAFVEAAPQPLQSILKFMLYTGCRPSEARRLNVRDVDLDGPNPCVHLSTFKGTSSRKLKNRAFPIYRKDFEALLVEQVKENKPGGILFATESGLPWSMNNLRQRINTHKKNNGFDKRWESMCFRHGLITECVNANIPILNIALLMGTSAERIEKNYHKGDSNLAEKLAALQ